MFLTSSSQNGDDAWELTCEFTADKTNQPIIRSLMDVSYLSLFVYLSLYTYDRTLLMSLSLMIGHMINLIFLLMKND